MYELLRFVKVIAVALLFTGSIGALIPGALRDRRIFAYGLAGPGFVLSWAAGFGLVWVLSTPLTATWILGGLGLSFVSLQGVLYSVGKDGRRTWGTAAFILVPLVATVALMIFKPV